MSKTSRGSKLAEKFRRIGLKVKVSTASFWRNTKRLVIVNLLCAIAYTISIFGLSDFPALSAQMVSLSIFVFYVYLLNFMHNNLELEHKKFWQLPCFYVFVMVVLSLAFVPFVVAHKEAFYAGSITGDLDAFYFGIISLTSVGFGEIHPVDNVGKIISIAMALLGSVHMIIFIALLYDRLNLSQK
ncbi:potassium channel family protein [Vibrio parahaemolyticus]|uniref:potassium channel family protein n=1 Tax=Vibrio parahaemolyticus TaxID=670 RepID=UPI00287837DA|nr:potassium channel family protein [Vibrio parahaemolyticus]EJG1621238.1 two pore domain potassium channel family protein [Vibrio parahaemolyticus]MDS1796910.1 potassium channel family protein [Vibrio parahaemolyticus]MDS1944884.1 potassium channel family protein [Vibrio parahaemolyticus]